MPSNVQLATSLNIATGSLNLATANFYLRLVTSEPSPSVATASGLAEVTGGNYAPRDLTGKQISAISGGGAKLTFSNPQWVGLYAGAADPIVGGAMCQKVGADFAGTDPVICYTAQTTSVVPSTASPGSDYNFQISADGILTFTLQ